jgi:MFS family permease
MMGFMTFTQEFKMTIIIMGIIGVVFSMLRHAFPKDSSANRLIAFGSTVYSGIYLLYFFGGFTPGVQLGMYSINVPPLQVLLGLQLIAWLLLGSSGLRALKYLIEAIEFRKNKEYRVKKKFKLSNFFKLLGTILSLVIFGYLGSVAYSGMNLGFHFHDPSPPVYDPGVIADPNDDTLNITITFDLDNQGLYAIYDVYINAVFTTDTSTNTSALPEGVVVGESLQTYFSTFHAFTNNSNNDITIVMDPTYIPGLLTTDATLALKFSFSTIYAAILINLTIAIDIPWNSII